MEEVGDKYIQLRVTEKELLEIREVARKEGRMMSWFIVHRIYNRPCSHCGGAHHE